ncbi:ABC transporter permease [Planosporangium flavigriseum]|uniref:Ribose ABC transporter permease n=1 Tax=Planosporangium flavigriseum TaxID=373681 RepID=A0A8J3LZ10_9ACTN|nr:ABC transporter permease [Planosporangium flavigriseum]NJC65854.1 ABC transporter permease [Planosporangium flavigriseum]GIG76101.1 ribose ABC transporter permease [Planosporangium flavigriseum]
MTTLTNNASASTPALPATPLSRRITAKVIELGLLPILLVAMLVVFATVEPRFLSAQNLTNVGRQSVYLLLVTLGQMIVLLCAQLDLSVGSTIALTSVITALALSAEVPPVLAVLAGLGVGLVVGLVNGLVVAFWHVPSFMVTLGTTSLATGAALLLSNGAPVTGVPLSFSAFLGTGSLGGIPVPVIIAVLVALAVYGILYWTNFGRNIFAIGGNELAATVAGIRVKAVLVAAFVVCSVLTSLAGVLLTARVASGEATLGGSFVLLSIAAAVLGGTSLFGGEGRIGLVVLGVIFIGVLNNGMNLLQISSYIQQLVLGAVLISAVALDRLRARMG